MKKTYTPRDNGGFSPYDLDNYTDFMKSLSGAIVVAPLNNKNYVLFRRFGSAVHHVEPEAVTISYDCVEHDNGSREIALNYYGNPISIENLRARVRELEKKTRAN